MDAQHFRKDLVFIALLVTSLIPQKTILAQDLNYVEIPLEAFHDEKPIELQGLISSQTLNVAIPQSWSFESENWMEIQFKASPLLDAARSSVTISLNDLQLTSYRLSEISGEKQRILIPANMFKTGNNHLVFTGSLYVPNDPETNCQNWDDPARWLAISPGAFLHLSFAKRDPNIDLSNFPDVLIEPLDQYLPDQTKEQILIVLPEDATQDDLTSLATLSSALGNNPDPKYDWHPEIVNAAQFNAQASINRDVVFIGNTPTQFENMADNSKDYVALLASPWSRGNAVMIIGDHNRQDGFSPAAVFNDPARRILLQGNVAYVEQQPLPDRPSLPNQLSFEDLGYLDRTVRGIGQQSLIYSIYIPYDIEPFLVKLNLGLLHSPDLDIQNSSFTVYLNGFSIAGILPATRNSTGEPITVSLPAKRFQRGINFIRISFDLHVPYASCERALESVWATLLNTSTLEMTYRNRAPIPSLKYFPLPFSDYSGSVFVIPDQYNQKELAYLSRLSFMIGNSAYQLHRPLEVLTASNFKSRETEYPHVILVGLPSENSVTRSTNALFPQPFIENGNSLQKGYGIYLPTSDTDASLGLMQIIPSPWVKGGTVLVLTGNDSQGLDWTWDVILNPSLRDRFAGNLMVVGSASRTASPGTLSMQESPRALFQQVADASNIPIIGPILQRSGQAFLLPAFVAIGTALFLIIGISWGSSRVRNRNMPVTMQKKEDSKDDDQ